MKIKSAVLRDIDKPVEIEELELDPPGEKEVLVKYLFTGFCHSDYSTIRGWIPMDLPLVIGHEAAGIVEELGPGVTKLEKGDHVVGTWMIPCGRCPLCLRGSGNLCRKNIEFFISGMLLDGTSRLRDKKGHMVRHGNFVSGFSSYSVVPEDGAILLPKEIPLDQACLMGCCVPTGWGAVTNTANVQFGESVVIYGLGGVGLNILRAAYIRRADPIIAVDIEGNRKELAMEFGATHFIDNSKEDPVPRIQEITDGLGADVVFEAIGDTGAQAQAFWSTGVKGKLVLVGATPMGQTADIATPLIPFHEKSILGSLYGSISTQIDIPRLVDLCLKGDLLLDKLITKKFRLEDINDVVKAMERREVLGRWVCEFE